jgi:hypothetical protein
MPAHFAAKSEVYGHALAFPVTKAGGIEGAVGVAFDLARRVQRFRLRYGRGRREIGWSLYMIRSVAHGDDVVRNARRVNCVKRKTSSL